MKLYIYKTIQKVIVDLLVEGYRFLIRIVKNGKIFGRLSLNDKRISAKHYKRQRKND